MLIEQITAFKLALAKQCNINAARAKSHTKEEVIREKSAGQKPYRLNQTGHGTNLVPLLNSCRRTGGSSNSEAGNGEYTRAVPAT